MVSVPAVCFQISQKTLPTVLLPYTMAIATFERKSRKHEFPFFFGQFICILTSWGIKLYFRSYYPSP